MDWNACGGNTVAFEEILICWFDDENYWWGMMFQKRETEEKRWSI